MTSTWRKPRRCARVHEAVVDQQVAPLHELRAKLARQEHVLVEGRVVDARRQQHDRRVRLPPRRQLPQRLVQQPSVVVDVAHAGAAVHPPQAGLDRLAVGDHVRHPGGHPQVVLQHKEPVVGPDEVRAADGHPHPQRRLHAAHLHAVLRAPAHHVDGDDAIRDDASLAVHVGQEQVERLHTLHQPALQEIPLRRANDSRDEVDGDDALLRLFVAVDREGDALSREGVRDALLNAAELLLRQLRQRLVQQPGALTRLAVRQEHFVEYAGVHLVVGEVHVAALWLVSPLVSMKTALYLWIQRARAVFPKTYSV